MCDDDHDPLMHDAYKFVIRLPEGMRDLIAGVASANRRSMNSEIVARLERSLAQEGNLGYQIEDARESPELSVAERALLHQFRKLAQCRQRALVSFIDCQVTEPKL